MAPEFSNGVLMTLTTYYRATDYDDSLPFPRFSSSGKKKNFWKIGGLSGACQSFSQQLLLLRLSQCVCYVVRRTLYLTWQKTPVFMEGKRAVVAVWYKSEQRYGSSSLYAQCSLATIKWIAFIKFALLPNKHRIWTLLSRDLSFLRRATVASFPNVVETDDVGTDQNKDI